MTIRSLTAVPLAVIGAATVVLGPFRPWYGDRLGREIPPAEVFGAAPSPEEVVGAAAGLLPLLIAAGTLAVLGLMLRSRLLLGLAGAVGLGLASLWLAHTYRLENSLLVGGEGLGPGAPLTLLGGGLLVAAAAVMPGPWLVRERTDPLPPVSRPINPRVVAGAWPDGEVPAGVVAATAGRGPTGTLSTSLTAPLHPSPNGSGNGPPGSPADPPGTIDGVPLPHP
ncbi:hypothetical protein [Streptomyces alkaliphilus]|uniref:hypothetical protein n=1 Tax=Streptomyces alkaliphilus TaxID=1472722 RepID=UPI0015FA183C|nr:hypothetical protein [Streptomyces alkaliphilus]